MSRQYHYSRATFGSSGQVEQKDIVAVSYGYTKIKPTVNGASTVSLNHNVPQSTGGVPTQMYIVKQDNLTKARTMEAVASFTTPAYPATSVATLTTPLASGSTYTVHYLMTQWQLDPLYDMSNFPDTDK